MKIRWTDIIFYAVIILFCVLMFVNLQKTKNVVYNGPMGEDNIPFKYCMAWGDRYDRSLLMWYCYNFTTAKMDCSWALDHNETELVFYEKGNPDNEYGRYNCTMYTYTYLDTDKIDQIKKKLAIEVDQYMRDNPVEAVENATRLK